MKKICIIDDDAIIRKGLSRAIDWEKFGYRVVATYSDGEEAIRGFIENIVPDVAVVDIKMPFMNGIDFTKIAREKWPGLEIVILSGFDDFAYVKELFLLGIKDYVLKPVDHNELIMAVSKSSASHADQKEDEIPPGHKSPVDRVLDYMYAQYADPDLNLYLAASAVNLSPVYLSNLFKQKVGKSFVKVLTAIRLEKAKELLRNSSSTVASICHEVGFSNPQYFSSRFKKETNQTPLEYRNSCSAKP